LFNCVAKLAAVVQPKCRNQSDARKVLVVPPGFHGMTFSLGRVVVYHSNTQSLPDVTVGSQQLLTENVEVAVTFSAHTSHSPELLCRG